MPRLATVTRLSAIAALSATAGAAAGDGETSFVFTGPVYTQLPEPYFPTMFVARDLDRDGVVDLVVPGRDPDDRLLTLRGNGSGGFAVLQTLPAEGFVDWVELADLDRDGADDLVAAWRGSRPRLVVHRGLGGGQFAPPVVVADAVSGMGRDPQGVALADFDGDGRIDVAVSSYVGHAVEVFANLGNAAGEFAFGRVAQVRLAQFFGGYGYPRLLAAGDLDGDGDADLVANELGGSRIAVLRNEGGRFARAVEHRAPAIGNERPGIAGLALADADGDGDLDVVAPALLLEGEQQVVFFLNDGAGGLATTRVVPGPAIGYAFATGLGDFDSDGDLDLATGAALPGGITFTRCDGAAEGHYARDAYASFGQLVRHVGAVDVDGDCDLDLVAIDGPSRTVLVRRNATPQVGCGGVASADGGRSTADDAREARPADEKGGGGSRGASRIDGNARGASVDVAAGKKMPKTPATPMMPATMSASISTTTPAMAPAPATMPTPPDVDLDSDGDVDAADRAIWLHGFMRTLAVPVRQEGRP